MGGGLETWSGTMIAKQLSELDILTVAYCHLPFIFEVNENQQASSWYRKITVKM